MLFETFPVITELNARSGIDEASLIKDFIHQLALNVFQLCPSRFRQPPSEFDRYATSRYIKPGDGLIWRLRARLHPVLVERFLSNPGQQSIKGHLRFDIDRRSRGQSARIRRSGYKKKQSVKAAQ
ncbi:hypothetical protein [Stenotrophomonas rhizophila]